MVDGTRQGRFLSKMEETIPGQFNKSNHGIDIFAIDLRGSRWVGSRAAVTVSSLPATIGFVSQIYTVPVGLRWVVAGSERPAIRSII